MTSLQSGRQQAVRVMSAGVLMGSSVPPRIRVGVCREWSTSRSFSSVPLRMRGRP